MGGHDGGVGFFKRKDDDAGSNDRPQPEPAPTTDPAPRSEPLRSEPTTGQLPVGADNLARLRDYLDTHSWNYTLSEDHPLIRMGYTGSHGEWMVYLAAEDDGVVRVHSVLSQRIPEDRRFEISHLLTLANFQFRIGGFQFDFSDGELRFHTSMDIEGGVLTPTMIENLLWFNLSTTDRYYRAIMAVSYGNVAALTAFEELDRDLPG